MDRGMTPRQAVNEAYKKFPVMETMRDELGDALVAEAQRGGATDVPRAKLHAAMVDAWAADGLTLSQRTTKGRKWVIQNVTNEIVGSMKKGDSVKSMAKSLFDGYGKGGVIPEQDIPKFMKDLTHITRGYSEDAFNKAIRRARRNIDKLSTKGLQAAYNGVIDAIKEGNQKKIDKAINVAVQEKTRSFAERIARTEKARAYVDGILYKYANNDDCIAFKWKLSTRHPCDDICDLYAHADLWGMGEGIFPKGKVPSLPVHPNCMCRLIPVFAGSPRLKSEKPMDTSYIGGMTYITGLSEEHRISLLGINGAMKVLQGISWKKYARGYSDKVMRGRIAQMVQAYKVPEYGDLENYGMYRGQPLAVRPVLSSKYDLVVADGISIKPRLIHAIESRLDKSISVMGLKNLEEFPKVVLASSKEMGGRAVGLYSSERNWLVIDVCILDDKWIREYLDVNGTLEVKRLATIVHELFHWKDARKHIRRYGKIEDSNKYIDYLCARYKGVVDKLISRGYDVDRISSYAATMRRTGRYDEVITEYRTYKALKGR